MDKVKWVPRYRYSTTNGGTHQNKLEPRHDLHSCDFEEIAGVR